MNKSGKAPLIEIQRPVDIKFPITCGFGVLGTHWKSGYHEGVDFGTPIGTPVEACLGGTVQLAGWEPSFGNRAWILSENGVRILYAHCSMLLVDEGDKVERGQVIARSGDSGNVTGPHLHVQVEDWPSRELFNPTFV